MSMIERVAASLYQAREENIERPLKDKVTLNAMAEAAIKALLNPTMEMVQAGDRFRDAGEVWRVMALTALKDEWAKTMTESADFYEQHTP